ncbi:uncharacterized protein LOC126982002 [Eriocheir sinensis]|uniref:uncharacterized protein LOC126982002 n=1 Tax=Eriocheir sinensis TaxID=95602 RepID=UPI0021C7F175|nr:uncharacterized protein LOC126982002 [Eriocheir sinensis]
MKRVAVYVTCVAVMVLSMGARGKDRCAKKKKELDRCLAQVAPFMPRVGLPYTHEELDNMCKAFKGGMRCVDGYTAACLPRGEQEELQHNLQGARSFLAFLCDDPVFQKEYLSHGTCLRDVSDGWSSCQHHYKGLVWLQHRLPNITTATRDFNICCIREELLACVYRYSVFRCRRHEALFVKKVTATLSYSDMQEEKCRNVSLSTCAAPHTAPPPAAPLTCVLATLCLCVVSYVMVPGYYATITTTDTTTDTDRGVSCSTTFTTTTTTTTTTIPATATTSATNIAS